MTLNHCIDARVYLPAPSNMPNITDDLEFKLQAAVGLANGLESELESRESLLRDTAARLRAIQEDVDQLVHRIDDANQDIETVGTIRAMLLSDSIL